MGVGFCFFVKWVLHSLRGITVQGKKKKKKGIWLQEEAGEFHGRENHWGSLTAQKSHLAEFYHLKIAGGWNSVLEDLYYSPYLYSLLTQSLWPLRVSSASSHHGLDGPLVWPQWWPSVLTLSSALMDYFCWWSFTNSFLCIHPLLFLALSTLMCITHAESKIFPVLKPRRCSWCCYKHWLCFHWNQ